MFFLNFTAGEFLLLFATLAGVVTALYLLDRSKSKRIVSTLRFWAVDVVSAQQKSRKRMREPWSFVLQILSILLLLLAIGQLQWGGGKHRNRKNVLLVDTSTWSSEVVNGHSVLDSEKKIAAQYISRMSTTDRVLLAGVDAAAVPATGFTSNRTDLLRELEKLEPSYAALDLDRALSFARRAEALSSSANGEVVYVGPALIRRATKTSSVIRNLRTILVPVDKENCGIRSIGLRRDSRNPELWNAIVTVGNYGSRIHALHLTSRLSGRAVDSRFLTLRPQDQMSAEYRFVQAARDQLLVTIEPKDALRADDGAVINVPGSAKVRLAVFTKRQAVMKPLIQSDENLEATFLTPAQYTPLVDADAVLLDQFTPVALPQLPALWIAPLRDRSPIPVTNVLHDAALGTPDSGADLPPTLKVPTNMRVKEVEVFQPTDGDAIFASSSEGPVAVGRRLHSSKFAVLGFDPLSGDARFETATPVLFAEMLGWLCPDSRRASVVTTGLVGQTTVPLPSEKEGDVVSVTDKSGKVPFDVQGQLLQVSTNTPSQLDVHFRDGGSTFVPVLADVAEDVWTPPADSKKGLPQWSVATPLAVDAWKLLALLSGIGFLADWLLFGQRVNAGSSRGIQRPALTREVSTARELAQR